jgi:hypothetical protein
LDCLGDDSECTQTNEPVEVISTQGRTRFCEPHPPWSEALAREQIEPPVTKLTTFPIDFREGNSISTHRSLPHRAPETGNR